ncbi:hypothetical protein JVT61DRAFT_4954 [Boletus reticuloceps]|uniref:peptide-methionine (S)-S-oxide reductase n=1 Tax=Boletus reticuloceps TaxID=495285 RepID=A0A8I2YXM6_9AGAM|nr:hypothetical protein JVT61DRAFT_4954 [Boletus reticuloceps]
MRVEYRSAIFTHSPEQASIAERATEEVQAKHFTEILEAGLWYDAEDYHQLYLFKNPHEYAQIALVVVSRVSFWWYFEHRRYRKSIYCSPHKERLKGMRPTPTRRVQ